MNRPVNQRPADVQQKRRPFGVLMAAMASTLGLVGDAIGHAVGSGGARSGTKRTGSMSGSQNKVRRMLRRMDPKHRKRALANARKRR